MIAHRSETMSTAAKLCAMVPSMFFFRTMPA